MSRRLFDTNPYQDSPEFTKDSDVDLSETNNSRMQTNIDHSIDTLAPLDASNTPSTDGLKKKQNKRISLVRYSKPISD